jgi:hypothetical protein
MFLSKCNNVAMGSPFELQCAYGKDDRDAVEVT